MKGHPVVYDEYTMRLRALQKAAGDVVAFRMKQYAEEHGVSVSEAMAAVLKADPKLKEQYLAPYLSK